MFQQFVVIPIMRLNIVSALPLSNSIIINHRATTVDGWQILPTFCPIFLSSPLHLFPFCLVLLNVEILTL